MATRIKHKTVRKMLGSEDVLSLFQDMMGTSEGKKLDYDIVWPKFKKIRYHSARLIKILKWLVEATFVNKEKSEIEEYVQYMEDMYRETFTTADLDENENQDLLVDNDMRICHRPDFSKVPGEDLKVFTECYKNIEDTQFLTIAANICEALTPYRAHIGDKYNLDDRIFRICGIHLSPIPNLPQCNFKHFHTQSSAKSKESVKVYLHKLYTISHDIYEATQIPDIDPQKFAKLVMTSMKDVKKHIPRCDKAFKILENSVGLLESNFQKYYTDMKCSGNTSVIMENFIMDVTSDNESADISVRSQFRTIISKYRKLMSGSVAKDPRNKELLKHVEANLDVLENGEGLPSEPSPTPAEATAEEEVEEDAAPAPTKAEKKRAAKARNLAHKSMDKAIEESVDFHRD